MLLKIRLISKWRSWDSNQPIRLQKLCLESCVGSHGFSSFGTSSFKQSALILLFQQSRKDLLEMGGKNLLDGEDSVIGGWGQGYQVSCWQRDE